MKLPAIILLALFSILAFSPTHAAPVEHGLPLVLQKTRLVKPANFHAVSPVSVRRSVPSDSLRADRPGAGSPKVVVIDRSVQVPLPQIVPETRQSQATLVFTSTHLNKGVSGVNVGTGALMLFEAGGQCELPPRALGGPQEVNADHPQTRLQVPAGQPLVLSSFWSAGGSHCLMGNYGFTAEQDATYKITSVQDRAAGVCWLDWQKLQDDSGQFVADANLLKTPAGCQQAGLDL